MILFLFFCTIVQNFLCHAPQNCEIPAKHFNQTPFQEAPSFSPTHYFGRARRGVLHSGHGPIETPGFFFCATQGALKGLSTQLLRQHHIPALLANTYHLMIQPGIAIIEEMGGLHKFMNWNGPLFTDSGGYQIFSLSHGSVSDEIKGRRHTAKEHKDKPPCPKKTQGVRPLKKVKITEEGAVFYSHRDGSRHLLTPELSMEIQCRLGVDFMCALDECTPLHMTPKGTERSMHLSHRWEGRSLQAFSIYKKPYQGLYGIVQGGIYPELRRESSLFVANQDFFGHAIGGSLGGNTQQMRAVVRDTLRGGILDARPIHLLGIGGLKDIYAGVTMGIDTFDCVSPTRLGRHGGALIRPHYWNQTTEAPHTRESINLWKACFAKDKRPIDDTCPCQTCACYSRAYLHHLLRAKEMWALSALTLHNVVFMTRFMSALRNGIVDKNLSSVAQEWIPHFSEDTL